LGKNLGIASSGHPETSRAAAEILKAGGNAFDAVLAALCTAIVAEPLLVSLGGGGFLVAKPTADRSRVYDFFCQTPSKRRPEEDIDFYPIMADFGTALQEFHIGMGSMAVPGVVAGLFEIHRDLARMPISDIISPAVDLARAGVPVDSFQHYITRILRPILEATPQALSLFESRGQPGQLVAENELLRNPDFADALLALAAEGPDLFYRGEWARQLAGDSREMGGQITYADLEAYRVMRRDPVRFRYRGAECAINAPPSPGGCLVAFALGLLSDWLESASMRESGWGNPEHLLALLRAMRASSLARKEFELELGLDRKKVEALLDEETLRRWREGLHLNTMFSRGTTHISVADADGNLASLTGSNGEGCAYVMPGTGIMLNNMLGEEDLNQGGFHRWAEGRRMASMMSPALAQLADGTRIALGSGGSNRIRSAVMQVLVNLLDFRLPLVEAVAAPRIHLENEMLSYETGFRSSSIEALAQVVPQLHEWPEKNLFFGGVHAVTVNPAREFAGAGDPRRCGAVALAVGG
jgi:gamma-glutamyltranspeptidase/glutathione hydrolase